MASIYRNASLTIAAASARDATQGLFPPASAESLAVELTGMTDTGLPLRILGCRYLPHPPAGDARWLWPLFLRGWALQERVLSPRTAYFCSDEIIWACEQCTVCECGGALGVCMGPYGRSLSEVSSRAKSSFKWHEWVVEYTHLKLSVADVQDWPEKKLEKGQAPCILPGFERAFRVSGYFSCSWRAPSWSWAALDVSVAFPTTQQFFSFGEYRRVVHTYIDTNETRLQLSTSDITGQLRAGAIKVTAPIVNGELRIISRKDRYQDQDASCWLLSLASGPELQDKTPFEVNWDPFLKEGDAVYMDEDAEHFGASGLGALPYTGTIHCIRMTQVRETSDEPPEADEERLIVEVEYALVLHCPNPEIAQYERVGVATQTRRYWHSGDDDNAISGSTVWTDASSMAFTHANPSLSSDCRVASDTGITRSGRAGPGHGWSFELNIIAPILHRLARDIPDLSARPTPNFNV
ncbi:hypothetical protein F4778DRAFT_792485 [Xylariomycetidae sp. FL2044]|nr:hypothetical protein F4778DRAFT_792485 [Xylariomycetidae sp. FL2044]